MDTGTDTLKYTNTISARSSIGEQFKTTSCEKDR